MALSSTGQINVTCFFPVFGRIGRFLGARSTEGGIERAPQGGMEREIEKNVTPFFLVFGRIGPFFRSALHRGVWSALHMGGRERAPQGGGVLDLTFLGALFHCSIGLEPVAQQGSQ